MRSKVKLRNWPPEDQHSEFPTHLIHEGQIVKEDAKIAESFNSFFVNIGPKLANEIKININKSYKTYLTERISSRLNFSMVDRELVEGKT